MKSVEAITNDHHQQKGQNNHATYLHFKHNYGWLDGFVELYNAYLAKISSLGQNYDLDKMDRFFQSYTKALGLEPELKKRRIDMRKFSLSIEHKVDIGGIIKNPTIYKSLYAGELLVKTPDLIPFISLVSFISVTYENKLAIYTLKLIGE